jgi:23S rRNA pseudouridine1911/1915/1917 synthase
MSNRILIVGKRQGGQTLAAILSAALRLSRREIEASCKNRWVRLDGAVCQQPGRRVRAGQRLQVVIPSQKKSRHPSSRAMSLRFPRVKPGADLPPLARAIRIIHVGEHIVVVDKPAGLTTVRHADEMKEFGDRARKFLPPTLVDLLPRVVPELRRGRLRAVHRLDKETSGLVVLARTPAAESALGKQFRAHAVERTYLALVRGQAWDERIESHFVLDRGDGRRGSSTDGKGQRAVTHMRVVEPLGGFTLVACRLETGRTHQVRIHLGELGVPLCGEHIYDRPLNGKPLADESGAKRPILHAATLVLTHPATGKRMAWESEMPNDMGELLSRLRSSGAH